MKTTNLLPTLLAVLFTMPGLAQTGSLQRDVNQQQRIEDGLQSGQLTTREAARLEREQAQISRAQAQAMKDGTLSLAEKRRLHRMQDRASHDIYAEKHDVQSGNPDSPSSRRMQADVRRDINQDRRILAGVKDGSLTDREAVRLERGQARMENGEYRAGRDGHIGMSEQHRIRRAEIRQSQRIHRERHDGRQRG